jgi:hypothetical protein
MMHIKFIALVFSGTHSSPGGPVMISGTLHGVLMAHCMTSGMAVSVNVGAVISG